MIDVAAQGEKSLKCIGDVRFDLLRWHTRVKCGHHHNRNLHFRKQVHRHSQNRGDPDDRNHQAKHDDEIRIGQRKLRHYFPPAGPAPISISFGWTFIPLRNSLRLPTTTSSPSFNPVMISTRVLPCIPRMTFRSSSMLCELTTSTAP